jgi:hypothetical protein
MLKDRGVRVSYQMARRSSSGRAENETRGEAEMLWGDDMIGDWGVAVDVVCD